MQIADGKMRRKRARRLVPADGEVEGEDGFAFRAGAGEGFELDSQVG